MKILIYIMLPLIYNSTFAATNNLGELQLLYTEHQTNESHRALKFCLKSVEDKRIYQQCLQYLVSLPKTAAKKSTLSFFKQKCLEFQFIQKQMELLGCSERAIGQQSLKEYKKQDIYIDNMPAN